MTALSFKVSIIFPLIIFLLIILLFGQFFFVRYLCKNLGIYLGWLPSLVFLILTIFLSLFCLIPLVLTFGIYILAAVLRVDHNNKVKQREESKLKEIDKMSINDL